MSDWQNSHRGVGETLPFSGRAVESPPDRGRLRVVPEMLPDGKDLAPPGAGRAGAAKTARRGRCGRSRLRKGCAVTPRSGRCCGNCPQPGAFGALRARPAGASGYAGDGASRGLRGEAAGAVPIDTASPDAEGHGGRPRSRRLAWNGVPDPVVPEKRDEVAPAPAEDEAHWPGPGLTGWRGLAGSLVALHEPATTDIGMSSG